MTIILKRFSIKNTRKANQALLRIFSIETFQSNRPLGRQSPKLFRICSIHSGEE